MGSNEQHHKKKEHSIESRSAYSSKAEKYAQYRWDYAPEAINMIIKTTGISATSSIADIGAGTGILSQHFVELVKNVFAVEINPEMRSLAERSLTGYPTFHSIDGCAEATTLPDQSIDLITAAQAIHWFDPEPTKREFLRIIKPDGWLAILRNYLRDDEVGEAMQDIFTDEYGAVPPQDVTLPEGKPLSFYYSHDQFRTLTYEFINYLTWDAFLGSTLSASYTPSEEHPKFQKFEQAVRHVFDRFSIDGRVTTHGFTELHVGRF
ncbi:class I SAM-dependent methyltransferase [candidate division CSSED10-310 bacterium]|uniref:Class I SAM-dependent methyltransferase n=1 Tax=candidate division CSSED10-310 bacterium TaxID=2855610 RepID=A0ABV6Z0H3_UNCC1